MGWKTLINNVFQNNSVFQKNSVVTETQLIDCLNLEFKDEFDDRFENDYSQVPEFSILIDDVNGNRVYSAQKSFANAQSKFQDHFFIYWAYASVLDTFGQYTQADKTIIEGLQKCRMKYALYSKRGIILFHQKRLKDAVCCWMKSIALQFSLGKDLKKLRGDDPFLYLGYIAQISDMEQESQLLYSTHKYIRGDVQLTSSEVKKLQELLSKGDKTIIKHGIQRLCGRFFKNESQGVYYSKDEHDSSVLYLFGSDTVQSLVKTMLSSHRIVDVENAIKELENKGWEPKTDEEIVEFYLGTENHMRVFNLESRAIPPLFNIIKKFYPQSEWGRKELAIDYLKTTVSRCSAAVRYPSEYGTEENIKQAQSAKYRLEMASKDLDPRIRNIAKELLVYFKEPEE